MKINGTEYFRKTISATGQLDLQVLYLGGMPSPSPRYKRQLNTDKAPVPSFKGVIQDVQVYADKLKLFYLINFIS